MDVNVINSLLVEAIGAVDLINLERVLIDVFKTKEIVNVLDHLVLNVVDLIVKAEHND